MWYDKLLGGRKSLKELFASIFGLIGFLLVPSSQRADMFYLILIYWAACFGFYMYFNVKEKIALAKNGLACKENQK